MFAVERRAPSLRRHNKTSAIGHSRIQTEMTWTPLNYGGSRPWLDAFAVGVSECSLTA
jgi:hypothetical protein